MRTRLHTELDLSPERQIDLDTEPAQYLGRVLRLRRGDALRVFNGRDGEFEAEIAVLTKQGVTLELKRRLRAAHEAATESSLALHLVQGVSRGDRMDLVVQKTTELGVSRITPVLTQHGVVRLDEKRAEKRREHWQRVANSAAEQCGRIRPPLVDQPLTLNDWFGSQHDIGAVRLVLDPGSGTGFPKTVEAPLCLLVGPEGGFSDKELEDAGVAGFCGVSLGPRILRTETAAIAAVTLAQALYGDLAAV